VTTVTTLTIAQAEELSVRIWEAIEAQSPEWQETMREAIRSGAKPVSVTALDDDRLLVTFGGVPLLDLSRADLAAPPHRPGVN